MPKCLCALLLITACATRPVPPSSETAVVAAGFERERMELRYDADVHAAEYAAPSEAVLQAILTVAQGLQLPVESADARRGVANFVLQSNRLRIADRRASEYLDCGMGPAGPRADSYRITLKLTTQLQPLENGRTRVHTLVSGRARDTGQSSTELQCTSTAALEKLLASRIAIALGG